MKQQLCDKQAEVVDAYGLAQCYLGWVEVLNESIEALAKTEHQYQMRNIRKLAEISTFLIEGAGFTEELEKAQQTHDLMLKGKYDPKN